MMTGPWTLRPAAALVPPVFAIIAGLCADNAVAADSTDAVEFDSTFLQSGSNVDVSRFSRGNMVTPGNYYVDVWVNDMRTARDNVRFVAAGEGQSARACVTRRMLEKWGVDLSRVAATKESVTSESVTPPDANECVDVSAVVPQATTDFDFSEQRLTITVPQKYMRSNARGYVPPELWENGVNAGFLSYNANVY